MDPTLIDLLDISDSTDQYEFVQQETAVDNIFESNNTPSQTRFHQEDTFPPAPAYAYPIAAPSNPNDQINNSTPPSHQTSIFVQQDPPESATATRNAPTPTPYQQWTPPPFQPTPTHQQYMYTHNPQGNQHIQHQVQQLDQRLTTLTTQVNNQYANIMTALQSVIHRSNQHTPPMSQFQNPTTSNTQTGQTATAVPTMPQYPRSHPTMMRQNVHPPTTTSGTPIPQAHSSQQQYQPTGPTYQAPAPTTQQPNPIPGLSSRTPAVHNPIQQPPTAHHRSSTYNVPYYNSHQKDPTWPMFDSDEPFIDWYEMMALTASTSRFHSHLVQLDPTTSKLQFLTNLSQSDKTLLFKTITDSLPSKIASSFTATLRRTNNNHNGVELMTRLRECYDDSENYTESGKKKLEKDLESLQRHNKESFYTFYQRFELHLSKMAAAGATIPDDKELAKLLIEGFHSDILRQNWLHHIVNDVDPPTNTIWWKNNNLQYTYKQAEKYVKNIQSVPMTKTYLETAKPSPTAEPKAQPSSESNSEAPPTTPTPTYTTGQNLRRTNMKLKQFYGELVKSNNPKSVFKKYRDTPDCKCCFHPTMDYHTFMDCKAIPPTVYDAKCFEAWIDWKTEIKVGIQQKKIQERANRANGGSTLTPTDTSRHATSNESRGAQTSNTGNSSTSSPNPNTQRLNAVNEDDGYESEQTVDSNNSNNQYVNSYSFVSSSIHTNHVPIPTTHKAHYIPSSNPKHTDSCNTIVADSGATDTFLPNEEMFEYLTPLPPTPENHLLLGDDKTQHRMMHMGPANILLNGKRVRILAYHTPTLTTSLLSINKHIEYQGCYFHGENKQYTLAYPRGLLEPTLHHEVTMNIQPAKHLDDATPYIFDYMTDERIPQNKSSNVIMNKSYRVLDQNKKRFLPTPEGQFKQSEVVTFRKLHPNATIPKRSTEGSIGFDVKLPHVTTLPPNEITKIPTGLASSFPQGMYLRIADRSSLALKNLSIQAGVVDSDYRGEIIILIKNNTNVPITFTPDQKVAQFIFERAAIPQIQISDTLPKSKRNGGFGSTDKEHHKPILPTSILRRLYISTNTTILYSSSSKHRLKRVVTVQKHNNANDTYVNEMKTNSIDPKEYNNQKVQHIDPTHMHDKIKMDKPILPSKKINTSTVDTHTNLQSPIYKINHSLPKHPRFDKKYISLATGLGDTNKFIKNMANVSTNNITLSNDNNPIRDWGEVATMKSSRKNKQSPQSHPNYSDCWHMDIGYGPCRSIGGYKYTLLLVDKATRFKFIYGLKDKKESIAKALQHFLQECGIKPKLIRCDFDPNFLGGKVHELLLKEQIPLQAAPPRRQHQNGLVERHWALLVKMARNWLTAALLPTSFWWFAIKRACEVSNISKASHKDKAISPYELVTHQKPDYRQLFPMFSTAYIKYAREEKSKGGKWKTQTLKVITIGTCPKSDSLLFYHPPSKQIFSAADGYKFDYYYPSGPQFNLKFDGAFIFNNQSTINNIHHTPTHELNKAVYVQSNLSDSDEITKTTKFIHKHSFLGSITTKYSYEKATVLSVPIDEDSEPFTLQLTNSGDIVHADSSDIVEENPNKPININNPHTTNFLPWLKNGAKVTMYLPDKGWTSPRQGYLSQSPTDEWSFQQGRTRMNNKHPHIPILHFDNEAHSLILNKKLFRGWINFDYVRSARYARATSNLIAHHVIRRHISAAHLETMAAPTLSRHHKLSPNDKQIWDSSYKAEYDGLVGLDTWEVITEQQYWDLKATTRVTTIPTMAISVIKKDGFGNPIRAKYRIVALGNLDTNPWTKQDCFAPVLSQLELRFLIAIAVKFGCIPRTADIAQAFCQALLPESEKYILTPPAGCPITPPKSYWLLRKTLYGLKRSPRHWYEMARRLLIEIGLTPLPQSPCIFTGTLIPNEAPIYIGLYVDDMIYFSPSTKTLETFETTFGNKITTTFNGDIDYFLGIKFDTQTHGPKNVSIHMTQTAFIDNLVQDQNLHGESVTTPKTPYRSGYPVDNIPKEDNSLHLQAKYTSMYQHIIGSLNWLAISTRPDIATITSILAQYMQNPSKGHIIAAKNVIKYLKGTSELGISFHTNRDSSIQSFVKFPLDPSSIHAMSDANWGPQDQSTTKVNQNSLKELDLFKTRSISGFVIWLGGPLHWTSKRQTITARSTAESEIYATDETVKCMLQLSFLAEGLQVTNHIMPSPTPIFNDNAACVVWSNSFTTKGLRHVQIRDNAVRESIQKGFITVHHIEGKHNLADMFTKEDKSPDHFITIRDCVMSTHKSVKNNSSQIDNNHSPNPVSELGGCRVTRHCQNSTVQSFPDDSKTPATPANNIVHNI